MGEILEHSSLRKVVTLVYSFQLQTFNKRNFDSPNSKPLWEIYRICWIFFGNVTWTLQLASEPESARCPRVDWLDVSLINTLLLTGVLLTELLVSSSRDSWHWYEDEREYGVVTAPQWRAYNSRATYSRAKIGSIRAICRRQVPADPATLSHLGVRGYSRPSDAPAPYVLVRFTAR